MMTSGDWFAAHEVSGLDRAHAVGTELSAEEVESVWGSSLTRYSGSALIAVCDTILDLPHVSAATLGRFAWTHIRNRYRVFGYPLLFEKLLAHP